ncbi:MAG: cystathionine beta-lyase [Hyphomicrobium sp. 32-62-53]|nr:MAG: cystathionine beta-lyase [Hyphomicrobium sp. 12-62-95]OYY00757.1 MAG: cystathionine beta-lyase [Hyphomicrobium sp. 32-62-53]
MGKPDDQDPAHRAPATAVVHLGRDPFAHHGFVNPPVYRGSTVLYPTLESLEAKTQPYTYGRRGTPTVTALQDALTALAGGAATKLTASGYQAVTTALLAFAETGDHVLVADTVYEPTRQFCDYLLRRLGVETQYYDPLIGAGIAALFRPNTRLVYVESPGSQTFEMQDIPAIAEAAHAKDIWVLADNTWSSPLYCQPLALGADVVIEAGTKYLVGHADALLGFITSNARAAKPIERAAGTLGVCPGSEETFLGLRGLRTLDVRLARHQETGLHLAEWLRARPEVARVLHPGLSSDPGHALWKRDHTGATGLFSIILKPVQKPALAAFLDGLKLFGMGYSWGGYESLVIPFDCTSYRTATRWPPEGPALRFHAGLENVGDLIADLDAGFARLRAAS